MSINFEVDITFRMIHLVMTLFMVSGNVCTVAAVWKFSYLRQKNNIFITNMALADISVAFSIIFCNTSTFPLLTLHKYPCLFCAYFTNISALTSMIFRAMVSLERFVMTKCYYCYASRLTAKSFWMVSIVVWMYTLLISCMLFIWNNWDTNHLCPVGNILPRWITLYVIPSHILFLTILTVVCYAMVLRVFLQSSFRIAGYQSQLNKMQITVHVTEHISLESYQWSQRQKRKSNRTNSQNVNASSSKQTQTSRASDAHTESGTSMTSSMKTKNYLQVPVTKFPKNKIELNHLCAINKTKGTPRRKRYRDFGTTKRQMNLPEKEIKSRKPSLELESISAVLGSESRDSVEEREVPVLQQKVKLDYNEFLVDETPNNKSPDKVTQIRNKSIEVITLKVGHQENIRITKQKKQHTSEVSKAKHEVKDMRVKNTGQNSQRVNLKGTVPSGDQTKPIQRDNGRRITVAVLIVISVIIINTLPVMIMSVVPGNDSQVWYHVGRLLALTLLYVNALINPVIYAWKHPGFKKAFNKMFSWS